MTFINVMDVLNSRPKTFFQDPPRYVKSKSFIKHTMAKRIKIRVRILVSYKLEKIDFYPLFLSRTMIICDYYFISIDEKKHPYFF